MISNDVQYQRGHGSAPTSLSQSLAPGLSQSQGLVCSAKWFFFHSLVPRDASHSHCRVDCLFWPELCLDILSLSSTFFIALFLLFLHLDHLCSKDPWTAGQPCHRSSRTTTNHCNHCNHCNTHPPTKPPPRTERDLLSSHGEAQPHPMAIMTRLVHALLLALVLVCLLSSLDPSSADAAAIDDLDRVRKDLFLLLF